MADQRRTVHDGLAIRRRHISLSRAHPSEQERRDGVVEPERQEAPDDVFEPVFHPVPDEREPFEVRIREILLEEGYDQDDGCSNEPAEVGVGLVEPAEE